VEEVAGVCVGALVLGLVTGWALHLPAYTAKVVNDMCDDIGRND